MVDMRGPSLSMQLRQALSAEQHQLLDTLSPMLNVPREDLEALMLDPEKHRVLLVEPDEAVQAKRIKQLEKSKCLVVAVNSYVAANACLEQSRLFDAAVISSNADPTGEEGVDYALELQRKNPILPIKLYSPRKNLLRLYDRFRDELADASVLIPQENLNIESEFHTVAPQMKSVLARPGGSVADMSSYDNDWVVVPELAKRLVEYAQAHRSDPRKILVVHPGGGPHMDWLRRQELTLNEHAMEEARYSVCRTVAKSWWTFFESLAPGLAYLMDPDDPRNVSRDHPDKKPVIDEAFIEKNGNIQIWPYSDRTTRRRRNLTLKPSDSNTFGIAELYRAQGAFFIKNTWGAHTYDPQLRHLYDEEPVFIPFCTAQQWLDKRVSVGGKFYDLSTVGKQDMIPGHCLDDDGAEYLANNPYPHFMAVVHPNDEDLLRALDEMPDKMDFPHITFMAGHHYLR